MWMKLHTNCIFNVCWHYEGLKGITSSHLPWEAIWHRKARSKLAFFVWNPKWGKILAVDNLINCVLYVCWHYEDWCCMFERNDETADHLLLPLLVAIKLWPFIFVVFGVRWVR